MLIKHRFLSSYTTWLDSWTPVLCLYDRPGFSQGFLFVLTFWIYPTRFALYDLSYSITIMISCISCHSSLDENDQLYLVMDIGPELLSNLQERIQNEIHNDSSLCEDCFNCLTASLDLTDSLQRRQPISGHDINICFCCRASLLRRRSLVLYESPERTEVVRTSMAEVPLNARICYTCWFRVRRTVQRQSQHDATRNITQTTQEVIIENCISCSTSLFGRRTHILPEGPERNVIAATVLPREIPDNARVCYACWVAAQRHVRREQTEEQHLNVVQPVAVPEGIPEGESVSGPEPQEALQAAATIMGTIVLGHTKRVSDTAAICFVPGCHNPERLSVPKNLRKRLLSKYKLYVPKNARICHEHRIIYDWDFLEQHEFIHVFNEKHIEDMLQLSQQSPFVRLDFEKIEELDDDQCQYWTGMNKVKFLTILEESEIDGRFPKLALGLYLMKLRTGEPLRRIASLMRMAPSRVCKLIAKVRICMLRNFVPRHLGLDHLPREELIQKNLIIPEGLFGDVNEENRIPIIICDGTYVYMQKSSNYCFQKKSYSLHKYRNLVKPFLFVATDGHILDVYGPYAATDSDAKIMQALFQNENEPLRRYFQRQDIFILDRGFRDALPFLTALGYSIYKPESLPEGETQLPRLAANKSRCVTLCRWVVEVVNGRFKRDFKIFRGEYFNVASKHLMHDFKIAAALINAFHPPIQNRPDAVQILQKALERFSLPNYLGEYVIRNNINRRRANFRNIDGQHEDLNIFPVMTMSDLILFSLGIYQIKQARSYYGEHISEHGTFKIEVAEVENAIVPIPIRTEGFLIRGKIKSRHHSGKIHYSYLLLVEGESATHEIKAYYCSCICGMRTVGCCAHTMTLVWYLGWARHQNRIEAPASFLDGILVREDIENE